MTKSPIDRLDFYQIRSRTRITLTPYQATRPPKSIWRGFTWNQLRYWQMLINDELDFLIDLELIDA